MREALPLFPERASTMAGSVDSLYIFLIVVSVFFSLLIAFSIIYFAIRYRRRSDNERPALVHGGMALELVWTVIPFLLTMVMFGWGASVFFELYRPPDDAMNIYVVGKQWMWKSSRCGKCSIWAGSARSTSCTFRWAAP